MATSSAAWGRPDQCARASRCARGAKKGQGGHQQQEGERDRVRREGLEGVLAGIGVWIATRIGGKRWSGAFGIVLEHADPARAGGEGRADSLASRSDSSAGPCRFATSTRIAFSPPPHQATDLELPEALPVGHLPTRLQNQHVVDEHSRIAEGAQDQARSPPGLRRLEAR